jgi:hypothetical protein
MNKLQHHPLNIYEAIARAKVVRYLALVILGGGSGIISLLL